MGFTRIIDGCCFYSRSLSTLTHTSGIRISLVGLFCHINRSLSTLTHTSAPRRRPWLSLGILRWHLEAAATSRSPSRGIWQQQQALPPPQAVAGPPTNLLPYPQPCVHCQTGPRPLVTQGPAPVVPTASNKPPHTERAICAPVSPYWLPNVSIGRPFQPSVRWLPVVTVPMDANTTCRPTRDASCNLDNTSLVSAEVDWQVLSGPLFRTPARGASAASSSGPP